MANIFDKCEMAKLDCSELAKMTTKNWLHVLLMIGEKHLAYSQMAQWFCIWLKKISSFSQIGYKKYNPLLSKQPQNALGGSWIFC